ncbi:hypothetical protein [Sandaracinus amylolyticus]|uniref:Uncharacterized protein n=1 Tax=Sandaracinus amylolyticus TaxID=927083 RepID=A0A0F6W2Z2_9BACT|nr:hypothetical protein [Sandaracinus amylolyticus]AKF06143.1 hypothetical protein DB32_003292 [Sandaracinus amylolyticus]
MARDRTTTRTLFLDADGAPRLCALERRGTRLRVREGEVGATPSVHERELSTWRACAAEVNRLVDARVAEGWRETRDEHELGDVCLVLLRRGAIVCPACPARLEAQRIVGGPSATFDVDAIDESERLVAQVWVACGVCTSVVAVRSDARANVVHGPDDVARARQLLESAIAGGRVREAIVELGARGVSPLLLRAPVCFELVRPILVGARCELLCDVVIAPRAELPSGRIVLRLGWPRRGARKLRAASPTGANGGAHRRTTDERGRFEYVIERGTELDVVASEGTQLVVAVPRALELPGLGERSWSRVDALLAEPAFLAPIA